MQRLGYAVLMGIIAFRAITGPEARKTARRRIRAWKTRKSS